MMAAYEGRLTCPMCLQDNAPMKIAGPCDHAFCTECLSNHLGSQASGREVYPCPSCKHDCPLPTNGVNGLDEAIDKTPNAPRVSDITDGRVSRKRPSESNGEEHNCRVCQYQGKLSTAVNLCPECNHINLCNGCSDAHRTNPATSTHVLSKLKRKASNPKQLCTTHHEPLIKLCCTCRKPVCSLCIVLDHNYHYIRNVDELLAQRIQDIKHQVASGKERVRELMELQPEMTAARDSYCLQRDSVINEIETKVNECIDKMIKQKEILRTQVWESYKVDDTDANLKKFQSVVGGITSALEKAEHLILEQATSQDSIEQLRESLLSEPAVTPCFLDLVEKFDQEIESVLLVDDISRDVHKNLPKQRVPSFAPKQYPDFSIGHLDQSPFRRWKNVSNWNVGFGLFVQHVTIFGTDSYALAISLGANATSHKIWLCRFLGVQQANTISERSYGIAGTPSGTLAVLCDGHIKGTVTVKLFDKEGKHLQSVGEIVSPGPLSMSVNVYGQFVILSKSKEPQYSITTISNYNNDVVTSSTTFWNSANLGRISCGGRYTYISGYGKVGGGQKFIVMKYEIEKRNITLVDNNYLEVQPHIYYKHAPLDIAATLTDDAYVVASFWAEKKEWTKHIGYRIFDKGTIITNGHKTLGKNWYITTTRFDIRRNLAVVAESSSYAIYRLTNDA